MASVLLSLLRPEKKIYGSLTLYPTVSSITGTTVEPSPGTGPDHSKHVWDFRCKVDPGNPPSGRDPRDIYFDGFWTDTWDVFQDLEKKFNDEDSEYQKIEKEKDATEKWKTEIRKKVKSLSSKHPRFWISTRYGDGQPTRTAQSTLTAQIEDDNGLYRLDSSTTTLCDQ